MFGASGTPSKSSRGSKSPRRPNDPKTLKDSKGSKKGVTEQSASQHNVDTKEKKKRDSLKESHSFYDDEQMKARYLKEYEKSNDAIFQKNKRLQGTYMPSKAKQATETEDWMFDLDDEDFEEALSNYFAVDISSSSSESSDEDLYRFEKGTVPVVVPDMARKDQERESSDSLDDEQDFNGKSPSPLSTSTSSISSQESRGSPMFAEDSKVGGYLEGCPSDLKEFTQSLPDSPQKQTQEDSRPSLPADSIVSGYLERCPSDLKEFTHSLLDSPQKQMLEGSRPSLPADSIVTGYLERRPSYLKELTHSQPESPKKQMSEDSRSSFPADAKGSDSLERRPSDLKEFSFRHAFPTDSKVTGYLERRPSYLKELTHSKPGSPKKQTSEGSRPSFPADSKGSDYLEHRPSDLKEFSHSQPESPKKHTSEGSSHAFPTGSKVTGYLERRPSYLKELTPSRPESPKKHTSEGSRPSFPADSEVSDSLERRSSDLKEFTLPESPQKDMREGSRSAPVPGTAVGLLGLRPSQSDTFQKEPFPPDSRQQSPQIYHVKKAGPYQVSRMTSTTDLPHFVAFLSGPEFLVPTTPPPSAASFSDTSKPSPRILSSDHLTSPHGSAIAIIPSPLHERYPSSYLPTPTISPFLRNVQIQTSPPVYSSPLHPPYLSALIQASIWPTTPSTSLSSSHTLQMPRTSSTFTPPLPTRPTQVLMSSTPFDSQGRTSSTLATASTPEPFRLSTETPPTPSTPMPLSTPSTQLSRTSSTPLPPRPTQVLLPSTPFDSQSRTSSTPDIPSIPEPLRLSTEKPPTTSTQMSFPSTLPSTPSAHLPWTSSTLTSSSSPYLTLVHVSSAPLSSQGRTSSTSATPSTLEPFRLSTETPPTPSTQMPLSSTQPPTPLAQLLLPSSTEGATTPLSQIPPTLKTEVPLTSTNQMPFTPTTRMPLSLQLSLKLSIAQPTPLLSQMPLSSSRPPEPAVQQSPISTLFPTPLDRFPVTSLTPQALVIPPDSAHLGPIPLHETTVYMPFTLSPSQDPASTMPQTSSAQLPLISTLPSQTPMPQPRSTSSTPLHRTPQSPHQSAHPHLPPPATSLYTIPTSLALTLSTSPFPTSEHETVLPLKATLSTDAVFANKIESILRYSPAGASPSPKAGECSVRDMPDANCPDSDGPLDELKPLSETSSSTQVAIAESIHTVQSRLRLLSESIEKHQRRKRSNCVTCDCGEANSKAKRKILKLIQDALSQYVDCLKARKAKRAGVPLKEPSAKPTTQISMSNMVCLPANLLTQMTPCPKETKQQNTGVIQKGHSSKHTVPPNADPDVVNSCSFSQSFPVSTQAEAVKLAQHSGTSAKRTPRSSKAPIPPVNSYLRCLSLLKADTSCRIIQTTTGACPEKRPPLAKRQDQKMALHGCQSCSTHTLFKSDLEPNTFQCAISVSQKKKLSVKLGHNQRLMSSEWESSSQRGFPQTDSKFDTTQISSDTLPEKSFGKMEKTTKLIPSEVESSDIVSLAKIHPGSSVIKLASEELTEKEPSRSKTGDVILSKCDSSSKLASQNEMDLLCEVIQLNNGAPPHKCSVLQKNWDEGIISSERKSSDRYGLQKTDSETGVIHHFSNERIRRVFSQKQEQYKNNCVSKQKVRSKLAANSSRDHRLSVSTVETPFPNAKSLPRTNVQPKQIFSSKTFDLRDSEVSFRSPGISFSAHDQYGVVSEQKIQRKSPLTQAAARNRNKPYRNESQPSPSLKLSCPSLTSSSTNLRQPKTFSIRTILKNIWHRGSYIFEDVPPIVNYISHQCPSPNTVIIRSPRSLDDRCKHLFPSCPGTIMRHFPQ